jgi:hypothetical protein
MLRAMNEAVHRCGGAISGRPYQRGVYLNEVELLPDAGLCPRGKGLPDIACHVMHRIVKYVESSGTSCGGQSQV